MTEEQDKFIETEQAEVEVKEERFPELAELQEKTQRRLRSNQRFLERFLDEDFDDMVGDDDDDDEVNSVEDDDPAQQEEL
mgnify:CR=1 FL=1